MRLRQCPGHGVSGQRLQRLPDPAVQVRKLSILADGAARSADELVEGVLIDRGGPDFCHFAVAQVVDVYGVDVHAAAIPLADRATSATPC